MRMVARPEPSQPHAATTRKWPRKLTVTVDAQAIGAPRVVTGAPPPFSPGDERRGWPAHRASQAGFRDGRWDRVVSDFSVIEASLYLDQLVMSPDSDAWDEPRTASCPSTLYLTRCHGHTLVIRSGPGPAEAQNCLSSNPPIWDWEGILYFPSLPFGPRPHPAFRPPRARARDTTTAAATNMKLPPPPHGAASTLLALLSLSLLLLRLLLRLRLAAFRDAALSLHLLARLRLRPVHLRLSATTTLRVWCPSSPSGKPPLLLLHGFGGDAKWTWARNLHPLSRHFHVYAPDLVFFGAHSRSSSPLRSVAFQARCAADAMRLLGVSRYDVAGISYGGFVAYRMAAAEARDAVGRLVVMTSGVAAAPGEMREMAAREERTVEEALLPKTAEGLRFLVRRSMHRPPPWMPDFVLDDFIQIWSDVSWMRSDLVDSFGPATFLVWSPWAIHSTYSKFVGSIELGHLDADMHGKDDGSNGIVAGRSIRGQDGMGIWDILGMGHARTVAVNDTIVAPSIVSTGLSFPIFPFYFLLLRLLTSLFFGAFRPPSLLAIGTMNHPRDRSGGGCRVSSARHGGVSGHAIAGEDVVRCRTPWHVTSSLQSEGNLLGGINAMQRSRLSPASVFIVVLVETLPMSVSAVLSSLPLMCVDQRKERAELLQELLKNGAGFDPLPVLTQETLIIWGDKDRVFPVDLGHRLQRLEIVKDAGHALQLEGAEHVNKFIKSFLLDERRAGPGVALSLSKAIAFDSRRHAHLHNLSSVQLARCPVRLVAPCHCHRQGHAMGASLSLVPVLDYFARREFLAAGLRPSAVTLPYPDGGAGATCTVHYWAPPGEPRLPPLLLVHGFGPRATWQWRCQVGPLSRHFHVIVPDLLGFGGTTYPSEAAAPPPSEATQAATLAALLDALPGMEGKRVAAAGTSYGGFVTYWLARAAGSGRVGPVVIASSDLLKTAADDRGFLKRAGEGWSSVDEILLPAEPAAMRKLLELASYRPPPRPMMPDFMLRDFIQKLFTENRERLVHLLKGITVGTDKFQDVLILWGDHDQLFPLEKALEVIKKTGHAPQLEDPARFNKVMLDFLLAAQKPDPSVNGGSHHLPPSTHRFSPLLLPRAPPKEALLRSAMGLSVLPLMDFIARRAFVGAGLQPHTISIAIPSDAGEQRATIHYWAPPGEPRLPALLLIHGFGPMATWQWRRQVGPLSRRFHVIVPDLLGFGASSSSPAAAPPSETAQAAALAALLDALPGLAAGARVAVVGTSYGGFVAYALARAAGPGRVGPVVISNSDLLKTADDDAALLERAGGGIASTADLLMPLDARGARRLMELSFYRRHGITLLPDFVLRQAVQLSAVSTVLSTVRPPPPKHAAAPLHTGRTRSDPGTPDQNRGQVSLQPAGVLLLLVRPHLFAAATVSLFSSARWLKLTDGEIQA
ncbi:hypothetical protein HU200_003678 [Digitaria exilis]|uniref:AB hydrolase-1 domain-containing protein n=1 Tax=Digitaria exilis TaxID=1010633 RepID=A0A835KUF6_9POAL|nr:hypothetical protein HU200_003678 [Digitaria exilis]